MSEIIQITSNRGLVRFSREDLIEHNLIRWIRTSFKGIGKSGLISDGPFESVAAKLYVNEYPQYQVHIAEKCILNKDGSVDVILKLGKQVSSEMYNHHSTEAVSRKEEKSKAADNKLTIKQAAGYFEGHIERVVPQVDPNTGETAYHVKTFTGDIKKNPLQPSEEYDETIGVEDVDGDLVQIGDVVDILTDYVGYAGTKTIEGSLLPYEKLSELDDSTFVEYMKAIGLGDITSKEQLDLIDPQEYLDYISGLENNPVYIEPTEQSTSVIDKGIVRFWSVDTDPEIKYLADDLLKSDPELDPARLEKLVTMLYADEISQLPTKTEQAAMIKQLVKQERDILLGEKLEEILGNVEAEVPWAVVELLDPKTNQPTGKFVRVVHYELDLDEGDNKKASSDILERYGDFCRKIIEHRIATLEKFAIQYQTRFAGVKEYEKAEQMKDSKGSNLDITFPTPPAPSEIVQPTFTDMLKKQIGDTKSANTENLSVTLVPGAPQATKDQTYDSSPTHDTSEEDVSMIDGKRQS